MCFHLAVKKENAPFPRLGVICGKVLTSAKLFMDSLSASLCSHIDEFVLSCVVSILEEIGSDLSQEDIFDVESFSEMLTAYFPDFASIPYSATCHWIFELSAQLSKIKQGN